MTTPTPSEAARALAARRRREMFVCEQCGRTYEATVRRDQPNRACSATCRSKLRYHREKQLRQT